MTSDVQTTDNPLPTVIDGRSEAMREVMAKYGVTPADVTAPAPVVVNKYNLDEICTLKTQVNDNAGKALKVVGHSGPLMYLKTERHTPEERPKMHSKFDSYVGFYIYTCWSPDRGEFVITHGIPQEGPTELSQHIEKLAAGNLFQVAAFPTSSEFRLFKPIPVQG